MSRAPLPPINFEALCRALLDRADELVERWLPGGVKRGDEYVCGSLSGGKGESCSINLRKGKWADFSTDARGGDLLSLYAAINDLAMGEAAKRVALEEGLEDVAGIVRGLPPGTPPPPPRPPATPPPPSSDPDKEEWIPQPMVPPHATEPTFWHWHRQKGDIVHKAAYRVDGVLLGYVVRFRTSDGGKDTLPHTWCISERDGGGAWKWKTWAEPRPLYYPGGQHPGQRTVVLVEGEVKAETLQQLLDADAPGVYCVTSWAGGSKAWKKAAWRWLQGATVLLWPDCDSKREQLTKAELKACADDAAIEAAKAAKPFLPEDKQPGVAAMRGIGSLLRAYSCNVSMLQVPKPGVVVDGWDCGDAIKTDGWDFARVVEFFGTATPLSDESTVDLPTKKAGGSEAKAAKGDAGENDEAETGSGLPWWLDNFYNKKLGFVMMSRKTIISCLRNDPQLEPCLGFNELTGAFCTVAPWPWREEAAPLNDTDDLRLGDWISTTYRVPGVARGALTEAMHTVADERKFHPVREYLDGLVHDGKPRAEKWLMYVLQIDPETLEPRRLEYLKRIGKWWLMGMVARVYRPGCKFDYSLVLEGKTGRRKSTLLEVMAGRRPYYSDTHFDIGGNKDGFEQLQGLWLYELSEMSALRKADSESVKAFFSSSSDRYRSSYGRYVQDHPRQCVIGCTTNKRQYLYDTTGNRRFWPVWVDLPIRIEWFEKWRDQLFAEAVALFRSGERFAPTLEEEEMYFVPEQELRLVETGVQAELLRLLTREGVDKGDPASSTQLSEHTTFVTMSQLVKALGTDVGKSTAQLESQIRSWLEANGWENGRSGTGARPRGWKRPQGWPPAPPEEQGPSDPQGPTDDDNGRHAPAATTEGEDDLPI